MELTGTIHKIFPTETKGEKGFRSREMILNTDHAEYPQLIKMQFVQDRCDTLDQFNEGQAVKVQFELRGREWEGKYFTTVNAWKIDHSGQVVDQQPKTTDTDGLPF